MSIPTRASLLKRLRDLEDQTSWQEFFRTYWRLIYSVARKAGLSDAEAQDVVQETVITVARKMPEFAYVPGRDSFKGWLLQTTRWKIADQFRKRHPGSQSETTRGTTFMQELPDPAGAALEDAWDKEWRKHLLDRALKRIKAQVNPKHFEIFKLQAIANLSVQEVAARTGVTAGQVYVIKHRLAESLRKEVRELERQLI